MFQNAISKLIIFIFILLNTSMAYALESVGTVVDVSGGVWTSRDGTKTLVRHKTPVFVTDVITTDGDGRAEILFNDDTSLTIGANSSIRIDDFVFETNEASFAVSAIKGVSRVITGKVVEQNRDGFTVKTPLATVGIRGTIVTTDVGRSAGDPINVILDQIGEGHTLSVIGLDGDEIIMTTPGYTVRVTPDGQVSAPLPTPKQTQDKATKALDGIDDSDEEEGDPAPDPVPTNTNTSDETDTKTKEVTQATNTATEEQERAEQVQQQAEKTVYYQSENKQTGFAINVLNGALSNAYYKHTSQDGSGEFLASGGEGNIAVNEGAVAPSTSFSASGFDIATSGSLNGASISDALMNGIFTTSNSGTLNFIYNFNGSATGETNIPFENNGEEELFDLPALTEYKTAYYQSSDKNSGFSVLLNTGAVSNAYYRHITTEADGEFIASGGTGMLNVNGGVIEPSSSLSASGFTVSTAGSLDGASVTDTSMSGIFSSSDSVDVNFSYNINGAGLLVENSTLGVLGENDPFDMPAHAEYRTAYYQSSDKNSGFSVLLNTGAVSDAYYKHVTTDVDGEFIATGGTGNITLIGNAIAASSSLSASGFTVASTSGSLDGANVTGMSMSGIFSSSDSVDVNFSYNINGAGLSVENSTLGVLGESDPFELPTQTQYRSASYQSSDKNLGFVVNLNSSLVTDAYYKYETAGKDGGFLAVGGTGFVEPGRFIISEDFTVSKAGSLSSATIGEFILSGTYDAAATDMDVDISFENNSVVVRENSNVTILGDSDPFDIPTLGTYTTVSYQSSDKLSGFSAILETGGISSAFFVHKEGKEDIIVARNGTGLLSSAVGVGATATITEGFTYDGHGAYEDTSKIADTSMDITFSNENIASTSFETRYDGAQITTTPSNPEKLTGGASLDIYTAQSYRSAVYESSSGFHGFEIDLFTGSVTDAYFVHANGNSLLLASGGTGTLTNHTTGVATGSSLTITNFAAYEGTGDFTDTSNVTAASLSGNFVSSSTTAIVDTFFVYNSNAYSSSDVITVTETESLDSVQLPTLSNLVASYKGTLTGNDLAFGMTINMVSGDITDAYFGTTDDDVSETMMTGGSGILTTGNIVLNSSTFATQSVDSFSFSATLNNGQINVTNYNMFGMSGSAGTASTVGAPSMVHYQGVNGDNSLGFSLDTSSGLVSDAYISESLNVANQVHMSGGSGAFTTNGSGGYNIYIDDFTTSNSHGYSDMSLYSAVAGTLTGNTAAFEFAHNGTSIGTTTVGVESTAGSINALSEKTASFSSILSEVGSSGGDPGSSGVPIYAAGFDVNFNTNAISNASFSITATGVPNSFTSTFTGGTGELESDRKFTVDTNTFTVVENSYNVVVNSYSGEITFNSGVLGGSIDVNFNQGSSVENYEGNLSVPTAP